MAKIWAYVASEASPDIATKLLARIEAACAPLLHFPNVGPQREQLSAGLRVAFEGNYAIYYVHNDRELVIVRVLHGARDAAALAERGGFL